VIFPSSKILEDRLEVVGESFSHLAKSKVLRRDL
jgi:hypothetical protein